MRVLALMVLLALTGCQSPPPLNAAQAQCGHDLCYCSYKNQVVTASGGRRYGGQLSPEACYTSGRELDLPKADHDASARE
jgi:hypothetical protein